jgi:hypothetical protein
MSVYYNVKEHISTNNFQDETITSAIIDTLVSIGREMLYDRAIIRELSLHANGNEYFFKGSEITPKLHEIIRVINSATTMDLVMSYDSVNSEFPIAKKVSEIFKKGPCYANNLFYSLYNKADCNSGVGLLSAYGEKNGKFYCGPVELQNSLLVEGEWYNEDNLITFEGEIKDVLNLEDLKKCVAELSALGADVDFKVDAEEISLFVNNMTINAIDTFDCFVKLCLELDRVTDGKCGFMLEFVDTSDTDTRVLLIDLDDNGAYSVWMANV